MSRLTSPPPDKRSTKRSGPSVEPEDMDSIPENIADIVPDGDAILVLSGMSTALQTPIGLRVSSYALSMASPGLKAMLAVVTTKTGSTTDHNAHENIVALPEDDGDAMYILCNILHLRNDKLPARMLPELLSKVAAVAHKYQCVVAAGRATLQWFDRLYASKTPGDVWRIVEAAYLLDEPMFFARFTSRWILQQSLHFRQLPAANTAETQKLALMLSDRHTQCTITLRNDLDVLTDTCVSAFSKQSRHYIDWAPTMSPEPDETPSGKPATDCRCDPDGAMLYLGALRDAEVWPSTTWERPTAAGSNGDTIGNIVDKLSNFREPEYDDADKCEFCDDSKIKFTEQLDTTKETHRDRLWGLCLDCYKANGVNAGECRYEHAKAQPAQISGLGIKGV